MHILKSANVKIFCVGYFLFTISTETYRVVHNIKSMVPSKEEYQCNVYQVKGSVNTGHNHSIKNPAHAT